MSNKYIPNQNKDKKKMLNEIGINSLEELFSRIPDSLKYNANKNSLPSHSEIELEKKFNKLQNDSLSTNKYISFLGAGVYDHFIPAAIDSIVQREEFYTSYTPYQPEISQGTLQAIFEYQTAMCRLTEMDVSNASMYDGSTALLEACKLALSKSKSNKILLSSLLHPEWIEVIKTGLKPLKTEIILLSVDDKTGQIDIEQLRVLMKYHSPAAIAIQSPNFLGIVEDLNVIGKTIKKHKSLFIAVQDPLSLGLLEPAGNLGADIVVGDGQPLGSYQSLGGPHFGYFCTTKKLMRKMPGRIVGQTKDVDGNIGYVLTLQAREQHIRREKASSNICSNHSLNALRAIIYLSLLGKNGLYKISLDCANKSQYLKDKLVETEYFKETYKTFIFREFSIKSKVPVSILNEQLIKKGYIGGLNLSKYNNSYKDNWLISVTEKRTYDEIDAFVKEVLRICKENL